MRFEGLATVTTSFAQSVVRTSPGAAYDRAVVDADVARLLATAKFSAAEHKVDVRDDGVVVTFVLNERLRITDIRFVGNAEFSAGKLRKEVPVQVGDPLDTFRVREGADAILQSYRDGGYGRAQISYDERLLRTSGELVYTIEEGPRIRIRRIVFEGNDNIPASELTKKTASRTYLWIFRDGKFDEEVVEADAAALQAHYRDEGYLDARVGYRLDFSRDQQDLTVTFVIAEGTRYMVESVSFEGNTVFTDYELRSLITLKEGDPILQTRLAKAGSTIQDKYGASGYIYARVRPVRVFSKTPGFVRASLEITEGDLYRVGRIVVRGNEHTKDKVIRRALDLYPGEIFNLTKARDAQQNLRRTQLFSLATVTPVGNQPNLRDVLLRVEEARKAGDFVFGFGVTSNSGLVGSIVLDIKNFDLFDTPRSFSEFVKLRSFHGAGQRLRIEAQPGTELNRFRIDFTEPYLLDKPLRFDLSAYFFERGRDAYDERRVGGLVSLGRRLISGPLRDWYGELALRVETVNVDGLRIATARDVREAEGSTLLTSVKASLVRDRTDNRFVPTRGDRIRASYEQFGVFGGEFFGKLTGGYTWHRTLRVDEQERKSVLSLKGVAGYSIGDAPVFERFYAGGIGSIRGFAFRGVTPRQGLRDDAVGGEFMLLFAAEYSFPLYGELLRGVVFSDMGTVESGFELTKWRVALGGGIRLQIDFFGPIPLEFAVAAPIIRDENDDEQIFSFFIGATF